MDKPTSIRANASTVERMRRMAAEVGVRENAVYMTDDDRINAILDAVRRHYGLKERQPDRRLVTA